MVVDYTLAFAKGPLFIMTFLFMCFGLLRHVYLQSIQMYETFRKVSDRRFSLWNNAKSLMEWVFPVGHVYRHKPVMSLVSIIFHVGLIVVPIFLVSHIALWKDSLGIWWPGVSIGVADALTIVTIASAVFLFFYRVFEPGTRAMSDPMDFILLILLTIPFITGFMAVHPAVNPISYNGIMLLHILSAELVFVLIPFTKLAHCVLFFFDRVSSDIFWKMPTGAGEKVARELHGKEARV